jgi:hypothetical protein
VKNEGVGLSAAVVVQVVADSKTAPDRTIGVSHRDAGAKMVKVEVVGEVVLDAGVMAQLAVLL